MDQIKQEDPKLYGQFDFDDPNLVREEYEKSFKSKKLLILGEKEILDCLLGTNVFDIEDKHLKNLSTLAVNYSTEDPQIVYVPCDDDSVSRDLSNDVDLSSQIYDLLENKEDKSFSLEIKLPLKFLKCGMQFLYVYDKNDDVALNFVNQNQMILICVKKKNTYFNQENTKRDKRK